MEGKIKIYSDKANEKYRILREGTEKLTKKWLLEPTVLQSYSDSTHIIRFWASRLSARNQGLLSLVSSSGKGRAPKRQSPLPCRISLRSGDHATFCFLSRNSSGVTAHFCIVLALLQFSTRPFLTFLVLLSKLCWFQCRRRLRCWRFLGIRGTNYEENLIFLAKFSLF